MRIWLCCFVNVPKLLLLKRKKDFVFNNYSSGKFEKPAHCFPENFVLICLFAIDSNVLSRETKLFCLTGIFHFTLHHNAMKMIFVFAVIGETVTFASPNELTFLSNGEWYELYIYIYIYIYILINGLLLLFCVK